MLSFILNIPYSILGLIAAIISVPVLKFDFKANPYAILINVRSFWWADIYLKKLGLNKLHGTTIGHVVLLGPDKIKTTQAHELIHVEQFTRVPIIFPILYFCELFRKGYRSNKYEIEAYLRTDNVDARE